jgi:hypothetical protein
MLPMLANIESLMRERLRVEPCNLGIGLAA